MRRLELVVGWAGASSQSCFMAVWISGRAENWNAGLEVEHSSFPPLKSYGEGIKASSQRRWHPVNQFNSIRPGPGDRFQEAEKERPECSGIPAFEKSRQN